MIQAPPRTILEVFESLPEGTLAQIINDTLIITPSPDFWHQDTVYEIAALLRTYISEKQLGKVIGAPMDVYFNKKNVYQPDILFLSNEQMHLIQDGKIKGAPALIIEVLSSGTENYDKKEKKAVYEQAGVKEYWIVHPSTKEVIGYRLTEKGYQEISSQKGTIKSALLNTTIRF